MSACHDDNGHNSCDSTNCHSESVSLTMSCDCHVSVMYMSCDWHLPVLCDWYVTVVNTM